MKHFFQESCQNGKDYLVRQNLKGLGYQQDLKKLVSDEDPENIMQVRSCMEEMPRYKIPKNEVQFDILMSVLNLQTDDVCERALELIRMLSTNPILYDRVL